MRIGPKFSYRIPLKPGVYEMRLYFVETRFGPNMPGEGGEDSRRMNIAVNGRPLLTSFDIYTDAGGDHMADVRAFKDITPGPDGFLNLAFEGMTEEGAALSALVNAIEITPGLQGGILPIRILASENSYTDHGGRLWSADKYVLGGRLVRRTDLAKGSGDDNLYRSERWGRFDYSIPVPPGKYAVTLRFCEQWYRDGPGRLFDVYANKVALLKNLDVFTEAGGPLRQFERTFHGIRANAQGKLDLDFVPANNYAFINAIEVVDDSN
jgi:hypothetical protein